MNLMNPPLNHRPAFAHAPLEQAPVPLTGIATGEVGHRKGGKTHQHEACDTAVGVVDAFDGQVPALLVGPSSGQVHDSSRDDGGRKGEGGSAHVIERSADEWGGLRWGITGAGEGSGMEEGASETDARNAGKLVLYRGMAHLANQ